MLRGHKSPGTLVAEIKMLRTSHDGAFLIVEGKDDVRFWRPRRHAGCDLIDGEGKPNVIGAVRRLDATRFGGALGVVGSDFERLTGGRVESGNLLYRTPTTSSVFFAVHPRSTRCSPSTAMIPGFGPVAVHPRWASAPQGRAASPLGGRPRRSRAQAMMDGRRHRIRRFESAGNDVRTALLERALVFGRLRFAALLARPAVELQVKVQRFLDENTWTVDDETLIRQAVPDSPHDANAIANRLGQLPEIDPWHVVRGHDMIAILRIGLRRVLGDLPASIGANDIARLLRAGMSPEDLRDTGLWADLGAWEAANRPYAVLAD